MTAQKRKATREPPPTVHGCRFLNVSGNQGAARLFPREPYNLPALTSRETIAGEPGLHSIAVP
jgi:hypothetical protein